MTTIALPSVRHLTSAELDAEVGEVGALGGKINDAAAVTIAAQWQSPGTIGRHLAALASGAPVDVDLLVDDIDATTAEMERSTADIRERHEHRTNLDLLRAWAEHHLP